MVSRMIKKYPVLTISKMINKRYLLIDQEDEWRSFEYETRVSDKRNPTKAFQDDRA